MRRLLICSLLTVLCSLVSAYDFELVLDKRTSYTRTGDEGVFELEGALVPRVSGLLGDNWDYAVSAGLNYEYENTRSDPWMLFPELIEAGLFFSFDGGRLSMGRSFYRDPLGFIVNGYFDGAHVSLDTQAGIFSAAAWYTGLINKKRASIEMTETERQHNNSAIAYNDLGNTYFAPNRTVIALGWEHPHVARYLRLEASLLGQFDFTNQNLHSQYFITKMTLPFESFTVDLGGCFSLVQQSGRTETALAAEIGLGWVWQNQGLSFLARYSSGYKGPLGSFLPLTTLTQGNVFNSSLTGLTLFSLEYSRRLLGTLSLSLIPAFYISSADSGGIVSGTELFGRLIWSPFSDIMFTLGSGVYLPSPGNSAGNDKTIWRVELGFVLAFF